MATIVDCPRFYDSKIKESCDESLQLIQDYAFRLQKVRSDIAKVESLLVQMEFRAEVHVEIPYMGILRWWRKESKWGLFIGEELTPVTDLIDEMQIIVHQYLPAFFLATGERSRM